MKKLLMIAALAFSYTQLSAQDNYTIKSTTKVDGLPEEWAGMAESEKVVYIKGDKIKTEKTSMMANSTEYFDGKTMTSLSEAMGNKTGFTATKEELEADGSGDDAKKDEIKPKFENTTEKKTVAGYECLKTIVTLVDPKDQKELKINIWHTDKVKKPVAAETKKRRSQGSSNSFDFKEIKGYPMMIEFSTSNNGMDIRFTETVVEVKTDKVEDSVFIPNTEGYKMMTYKEMKDRMKQMQGGLGGE